MLGLQSIVAKGMEARRSVRVPIVLAVQLSKSVSRLLMESHHRNSHQRMLPNIRR